MKSMMDMLGQAGGPVRPPLVDLRAEEVQWVRETLGKWKTWV
jgi:hypothetical protein